MKLRLLLVDDQLMFLEMLRSALDAEPDFEVIGTAAKIQEALSLAAEHLPDFVLIDYELNGEDGASLAKALSGAHPGMKVLALSSHIEPEVVVRMLAAGAVGYLDKSAPISQLIEVIRLITKHRVYLCPDFGQISRWVSRGEAPEGPDPRLNEKEVEIIRLLAEGYASKEIADQLSLSTKTVDVYRQKIRGMLGLDSVASLTKYALKTGLISLD
ncbi:MAG: response regulator transcription factor [bacterium]|nr:response regulator transcription factor [bacterium]